jgi:hypothetical protein
MIKKLVRKFKHYFLNLLLIWAAILIYRSAPYYQNFLSPITQTTILYLALAYTLFGLIYYIIIPIEKHKDSKGTIIFRAFKKVVIDTGSYIKHFNKSTKKPLPKIERHEKTAFLFMIVKIFFLPIMLNFFYSNLFSVIQQSGNLSNPLSLLNIQSFNFVLFPFLLALIFLLDTLWFSFGYTFEASFLKNKIISVEPTILGWIVALACYPPFNGTLTKYINWYANDYILFFNDTLTFVIE